MRLLTYLTWMRRETRGSRGRMIYFAACLAVGVAAVVGTAALAEGVKRGLGARSREILGADVRVESRRPISDEFDAAMAKIPGVRRADLTETATMVTVPGSEGVRGTRLARLIAVSGPYPLYGELATDPPGGLSRHLDADTAAVSGDLLADLGLAPGAEIQIGGARFRVGAAVERQAGSFGFSALLGSTVWVSAEGLDRTGLSAFGMRLRHQAYFSVPGYPSREELERLLDGKKEGAPDAPWLDVDTHYESVPGGRRGTDRVEGFLGLVALLSLVVGGIGVSQIVGAWLAGRTGAVAVLRSIGMRPREILVLSLGHTALLALAGSLVGALAGLALPFVARALLPDLLPVPIAGVFPVFAVLRGVGLGVGVAIAFALPPLTAIWRVPPARVLRGDAEPLPPNRLAAALSYGALVAGLFAAAWVQGRGLSRAAWFTAGFLVLTGVLLLGARGLMALAGRLPRRGLSPYLVHGVAALARPGAGTTGAVAALGIGTMVVTGIWLVQSRMREGILAQIPPNAPTEFFSDVDPAQWPGLEEQLVAAGAEGIASVPVVTARLTELNGRPVEELLAEAGEEGSGRSRWALRREQRVTWQAELPPDNVIVAGKLWSDPDEPEVSVERRFADRLGVEVGSRIELDFEGRRAQFLVTSIRTVEWESFSLNFFLVAEPGSVPVPPELLVASARVPPDGAQALKDRLATSFPNVTVISVGVILEQVLEVLEKITEGIRLLGSLTVLAGLAILAGAVSATALRRGAEVALLKTLGVTRPGVVVLLATEYGLLGALAGTVGAGGALLLARGFLEHVAELSVSLPLLAIPVAAAGCGLLTAAAGVAASVRALTVRPIEALR